MDEWEANVNAWGIVKNLESAAVNARLSRELQNEICKVVSFILDYYFTMQYCTMERNQKSQTCF